ncbi:MAG: recombinase family protein, partial [Oscillospiraceae bacterium]|nr:recombinase family protein [Oscillospiraceae bacterium]
MAPTAACLHEKTPAEGKWERLIKVASYCRVSTDHEDQANSFEAQQRYFKEYIDRRPDWELYQVYADEGITGTSTKKRAQFNRMMSDAYLGKFQLIITKEVSRFSRNVLDTVSYTRELRAMGIGVIFMTDGIDTRDPDAELRLSIMGSIAQEESRKTSARVKWGQSRQMERGIVFGRSMLGYDVKGGRICVNPEGAEVVRQIFYRYGIEKKGISRIAKELRDEGFRTSVGSTRWTPSHLLKILKNEKYIGDLVQKKTYTPDYLTHEKKYNHGEEEIIIIRDHHEPIIDKELWDIVQAEAQKRSRHNNRQEGHSNRYPLSGKIKCGE